MNTTRAIEKTVASFRAPFENHCLLCARAKKAYNLLNLTKAPAIFSKYSPAPAARAATSAQFGFPPPLSSLFVPSVCSGPALALTIAWQQREPTNLAQCKFVFALNLTKLIKLNTRVHRQTCTNNDKRSQPRQTEPGACSQRGACPWRLLCLVAKFKFAKAQTHSVRELCEERGKGSTVLSTNCGPSK